MAQAPEDVLGLDRVECHAAAQVLRRVPPGGRGKAPLAVVTDFRAGLGRSAFFLRLDHYQAGAR